MTVAMDRRGAIGIKGKLPWDRCREDMSLFRLITSGGSVIMGRRTKESIGDRLKNRVNVVLTRDGRMRSDGGEIWMTSIEAAHAFAEQVGLPIFYIGGESVYRQALDRGFVDTLYITTLDVVCEEVDAWFPTIDMSKWEAAGRMRLTESVHVMKYMRKLNKGEEDWQ